MKSMHRLLILFTVALLLSVSSAIQAQDGDTLVPAGKPGETYYAAFPVNIKLDGDLSDWAKIPRVKVTQGYRGTKDPGEDESLTWAAAADAETLYLLGKAADIKIISGQHGKDYWNEDSVEFYINATDNLLMRTYKAGVVQLTIPTVNIGKTGGDVIFSGVLAADAEAQAVMVKTDTGYAVEVALPLKTKVWEIIPAHGKVIGINAQMNGASESNRNTKLMWSNLDQNDQSYQNPSLFGLMIFYKVGETQAPVVVFTPTPTPAPILPVPVGKGSYSKTLPAGYSGPIDVIAKTDNIKGAMPTNEWWSALAWKTNVNFGSNEMYAHPLALQAKADGLGISYPTTLVIDPAGNKYEYPYREELTVGIVDLKINPLDVKVDSYSDWAVTAVWGDNLLKATAGHGLPFVYFTKGSGDALITFAAPPMISVNADGVVRVSANGRHYGIFGPSGSTWTVKGNVLQSSLNGKDYFSIAALPDPQEATFEEFKAHAYAFVTDTKATYRYDPKTAAVTTTFSVTTEPKEGSETATIQALYRHQWLSSKDVNTTYSYVSPRGEMKVLIGNTFTTTLSYQGVLPYLPAVGGDKAVLQSFVDEISGRSRLNSRLHMPGPNGEKDTYWTGKGIGRSAQLVAIADSLDDTKARDLFLSDIKKTLENWLLADPGEFGSVFYYEPNWGALIGYPAANFGYDTMLNDHNFHHGYYIMAAAMVGLYDPDWIKQENWGGMVELLIRDAANWDRTDTMFPYLRNFDPYAGHSWADGPNGSNQESSSEAMNFATGLILWGQQTGNPQIRDLGIWLYTTEADAVHQYWFDVDQAVFPKGFDHTTIGILWMNGGTYGTYFSDNPEMIHGINLLPFNAGSLYLGRNPDYIKRNYAEIIKARGGLEQQWVDIIRMFQALADPDTAIKNSGTWDYEPEWGLSQAETYRWLYAMQALGRVDTSVTADTALYAVFNKDGKKTYVAFNASDTEITVTFSDGTTLTAPAHKLTMVAGK